MSTLPTQQPVDDAFKSNDSTYSNPRPIAAATSLATPAPDIHDTPLFHQLIGIIQEHNATAKEQRDIMQGMRRSLELLQEQSSIRPLQRDIPEGQSGDTNGSEPTSQVKRPQDSTAEPPRDSIHEALQRLREVMEGVKDTLGNVKETLLDHGKKFDILTRDAIKDDQPYDQKELEDESTCTALFEMAMTKTKEEVDEWIKRMDVSLVFIALFSTVLTAFVVPATQNLFPSSSNTPGNPTGSAPPLPKVSAENVCLSYYLALILAILDAVLSVLGRQWMSRLTNRPEGTTCKERLLRHLERERLAKGWLRYLVAGLNAILFMSIGLFVTGLLYQLWNLSGSFEVRAPRLFATWCLGLLLSLSILGVVLGATVHALIYEASPFGGPFSKLISRVAKTMAGSFRTWMERVTEAARWLDSRYKTRRRPFQQIVPFIGRVLAGPLWMSSQMDLVAEASDPKLLERAVASFSYVEWVRSRDQSHEELTRLKKTWDRLTATDTSLRVRETLIARARQLVPSDGWDLSEVGERLSEEMVQFFLAIHSYPQDFRDSLMMDAIKPNNADLRPLAALPSEECIARVLCSYNHEGILGDRREIFHWAQKHCYDLLKEGKRDDVARILSHVDRLDLIKSFIQYPHGIHESLVEFIVKDHKNEILRKINEFVKTADHSRFSPYSLSGVFVILASPPPTDNDLSQLIDYLSRYPHNWTWKNTSETIIRRLHSFPLSQVSDQSVVRWFLQQCVDGEFRDNHSHPCYIDNDICDGAGRLLTELNSISIATGVIASGSNQPASPSHSPFHTPPPNDSPQPDPLLSPSADSLSPASVNVEVDTVPVADSHPDTPLITLHISHPRPVLSSFVSTSDPSLAPVQDSQAVFAQLSTLENAHQED